MGRSIALAHVRRSVPFAIADQDAHALERFADSLHASGVKATPGDPLWEGVHTLLVGGQDAEVSPVLMIESVAEDLEVKQQLFRKASQSLSPDCVLASNTSTLRLNEIFRDLPHPERVGGMHFFMPVEQRSAVEIIRTSGTSRNTVERISKHASDLGKRVIECRDAPGFVVNRLLSPYLNQALRLLCHGCDEGQLERAALAFGMPLSPLELIDWIGARTMYQAGRAFLNAFPKRMDPSPIVPALVKRERFGRHTCKGLFDYDQSGRRSQTLAAECRQLIADYQLKQLELSDGEVLLLLSIPMWIEAQALLREEVVDDMGAIDLAMVGGLGFRSELRWSEFFQEVGARRIEETAEQWSGTFRTMQLSRDKVE